MRHLLIYVLLGLMSTACGVVEDSPVPEPQAMVAPTDVAAPPEDTQVTASGISYRVLQAGTGEEHPGPKSEVTVHYSGWTTDGAMFDSSVERGEPTSFPLNKVIRGWTEGLQLMVMGEKTRFWIPEKLAYGGRPGKPAGMLVFDIELISFVTETSDEAKGKPTAPEPPEFPADGANPPETATDLGDGLLYLSLKPPRAPRGDVQAATPTMENKVEIRYNGWTQQGEFVAGIAKRGRPESLSMKKISTAWSQVLLEMAEGQKVRIWASAEASSTVSLPATEAMVYELELLRVKETLPPPADVAAAPADATTTPSGLAWRRLKKGTGREHPSSRSEVEVHYSGWTTDGEMFDSSVLRKSPSSFKASRVISGWTEGLQLMVEGDSYRFWIPEELAYKGKSGKPAGMLVFDVELLTILSNPPPPPAAPSNAASAPADAIHIEDGIDYILLKSRSSGVSPAADAWVKIHVIDWTQAGVYIGGTDESGEAIARRMEDFSPAWQKTLLQMKVGEKARIWGSLAQSTVGRRSARGDMVTEIELVAIGESPAAPADVSGPPADASTTPSGLAYEVLQEGNGDRNPVVTNKVEVHYSGWTTDGALFDSSLQRMAPANFPLNRVIPGWTEGLQLMVVGQKTRFWIPVDLAYKGAPGKPAGMLVFDIELLKIL